MAFKAEFKVSDDDIDEINYKLSKLAKSEEIANKALRKGAPVMYKAILDLMPAYMGDGTTRHKAHKKHARNSQPLKTQYANLGFSLTNKKAFGYLYFPDQGQGTSKGNAQEFMETGADDAYKDIIDIIHEALDKELSQQILRKEETYAQIYYYRFQ